MKMTFFSVVLAMTLAACNGGFAGDARRQESMHTMHHDGLCFVVFSDTTGAAMVEVDCEKLGGAK